MGSGRTGAFLKDFLWLGHGVNILLEGGRAVFKCNGFWELLLWHVPCAQDVD